MICAGIPRQFPPLISLVKSAGFGDFQANGIIAAAKMLKMDPKELANQVVLEFECTIEVETIDVSGPGFINIYLSNQWLSKRLEWMLSDKKLGITMVSYPKTVVIDYSAPNLAKEMHVGHLRSTIIGDAQARLLEFLEYNVIRQNHIGDWGTQFGMLIAELDETLKNKQVSKIALKDLELFYQQSKKHFDQDDAFAANARSYVVKLQSGDLQIKHLWQQFIEQSLLHIDDIYKKLNVSLSRKDVMGESAYNHDLPLLVKELEEKGLALKDKGAIVAFLDEFPDKNNKPSVMIIQKQDGGYLYSTTDLAAIRYRANQLKANSILYFIDARQSLHLKQVFCLARKAGFIHENLTLNHCAFGTMMGSDGKPFKTRSGGVIKLAELLNEAILKAEKSINSKSLNLSPDERKNTAIKVGIGAIKYSDLSKKRTNDYAFNWDEMLSLHGNTAPYLQYAYARIKSLLRKSEKSINTVEGRIKIINEEERILAIKLINFDEVLNTACKEAMPHLICNYLYELSKAYMSFYEHCPILKEEVKVITQISRLMLCNLVARTLKTGLNILGIEVMDKM